MSITLDILTLKPTTFRLETELMEALAVIRARDGIGVSEQVRRALKRWIAEKGVKMKSDRRGARTPRRS
jgi:hypothetical protein